MQKTRLDDEMSHSQAYAIEIEIKAEHLKRKSHEFKTSKHEQPEVECDVSQNKLSQHEIENPHSIHQCRDVPNMYKQKTTSQHEECTTQCSQFLHSTLCNGNTKQMGVHDRRNIIIQTIYLKYKI